MKLRPPSCRDKLAVLKICSDSRDTANSDQCAEEHRQIEHHSALMSANLKVQRTNCQRLYMPMPCCALLSLYRDLYRAAMLTYPRAGNACIDISHISTARSCSIAVCASDGSSCVHEQIAAYRALSFQPLSSSCISLRSGTLYFGRKDRCNHC